MHDTDVTEEPLLSREELLHESALSSVLAALSAGHIAVAANPEGRNYRLSALSNAQFARLRSTWLISALFSTWHKDTELTMLSRMLSPWLDTRRHLVFVPLEDGQLRVYHYEK